MIYAILSTASRPSNASVYASPSLTRSESVIRERNASATFESNAGYTMGVRRDTGTRPCDVAFLSSAEIVREGTAGRLVSGSIGTDGGMSASKLCAGKELILFIVFLRELDNVVLCGDEDGERRLFVTFVPFTETDLLVNATSARVWTTDSSESLGVSDRERRAVFALRWTAFCR